MSTDKPTWNMLGSGAVGTVWAHTLLGAQHSVVLLMRPIFGNRSMSHPLTLTTATDTREILFPVKYPGKTTESLGHIILAVKAYDIEAALTLWRPFLAVSPTIVSLQNGLGVRETILEVIPKARVITAVSTLATHRIAPNSVCLVSRGQTDLGCLEERDPSPTMATLIASLNEAGLPATWETDIREKCLLKFAINCCINGLTAIFQCRNGYLHENPLVQKWLNHLVSEYQSLLELWGITKIDLRQIVDEVIVSTAQNVSSMFQDILRGKPTEISYLNVYADQQAKQLGAFMPYNRQLIQEFYQKYSNLLPESSVT